jgi:integrase
LIANGVDIKTVSKRLGHSNIQTTGNIYTHQIRSADELASETIDLVLGSKKTIETDKEE